MGAFGILNHVESFLSFLSFLVCPIGGLIFADYWIVGKGKAMSWHALPGYNWVGIITWADSAARGDASGEKYVYLAPRPDNPGYEIYKSDLISGSFVPIFSMKLTSSSTINHGMTPGERRTR